MDEKVDEILDGVLIYNSKMKRKMQTLQDNPTVLKDGEPEIQRWILSGLEGSGLNGLSANASPLEHAKWLAENKDSESAFDIKPTRIISDELPMMTTFKQTRIVSDELPMMTTTRSTRIISDELPMMMTTKPTRIVSDELPVMTTFKPTRIVSDELPTMSNIIKAKTSPIFRFKNGNNSDVVLPKFGASTS